MYLMNYGLIPAGIPDLIITDHLQYSEIWKTNNGKPYITISYYENIWKIWDRRELWRMGNSIVIIKTHELTL